MIEDKPHSESPYSVAGGQIVRGDKFVGAVAAVAALNSLLEQLEALQREYAASREISKWALETKRCDEPSPQGDMLCDREPGHEGVHVNWQAAEWSQTSSPASDHYCIGPDCLDCSPAKRPT